MRPKHGISGYVWHLNVYMVQHTLQIDPYAMDRSPDLMLTRMIRMNPIPNIDAITIAMILQQYNSQLIHGVTRPMVYAYCDELERIQRETELALSQRDENGNSVLDYAVNAKAQHVVSFMTRNYFRVFPTLQDVSLQRAFDQNNMELAQILVRYQHGNALCVNQLFSYLIHNKVRSQFTIAACNLLLPYQNDFEGGITHIMIQCYLDILPPHQHLDKRQKQAVDHLHNTYLHYVILSRSATLFQRLTNGQLNFIPNKNELQFEYLIDKRDFAKFQQIVAVRAIHELPQNEEHFNKILDQKLVGNSLIPYVRAYCQIPDYIATLKHPHFAFAYINDLERVRRIDAVQYTALNSQQCSMLHFAVAGKAADVVNFLTNHHFGHMPNFDEISIFEAIKNHKLARLNVLLMFQKNTTNTMGEYPLLAAVKCGFNDAIPSLVEQNSRKCDNNGMTSLMFCCQKQLFDMAQLIVEGEAGQIDKAKKTALCYLLTSSAPVSEVEQLACQLFQNQNERKFGLTQAMLNARLLRFLVLGNLRNELINQCDAFGLNSFCYAAIGGGVYALEKLIKTHREAWSSSFGTVTQFLLARNSFAEIRFCIKRGFYSTNFITAMYENKTILQDARTQKLLLTLRAGRDAKPAINVQQQARENDQMTRYSQKFSNLLIDPEKQQLASNPLLEKQQQLLLKQIQIAKDALAALPELKANLVTNKNNITNLKALTEISEEQQNNLNALSETTTKLGAQIALFERKKVQVPWIDSSLLFESKFNRQICNKAVNCVESVAKQLENVFQQRTWRSVKNRMRLFHQMQKSMYKIVKHSFDSEWQ